MFPVIEIAAPRESLVEETEGALVISFAPGHLAEARQGQRDTMGSLNRSSHLKPLFHQCACPGEIPPLHAYPTGETFAVLTGKFEVTIRDGENVAMTRIGPGDLAHAKPGMPHRFENVGDVRGTAPGRQRSVDGGPPARAG